MRINRNTIPEINDRPLTAQRRLILDILREAECHLDARELYQRAIQKDQHISLATVYRNLRLFEEVGLVDERRLDEVHCYYEIKRSTEHYHLICRACGRVLEFESPTVSKLVDEVQRNSDFYVSKAELYLEGYCRECRGKKEGS
jgi:Fur family ferric uptake transcriptional regulator